MTTKTKTATIKAIDELFTALRRFVSELNVDLTGPTEALCAELAKTATPAKVDAVRSAVESIADQLVEMCRASGMTGDGFKIYATQWRPQFSRVQQAIDDALFQFGGDAEIETLQTQIETEIANQREMRDQLEEAISAVDVDTFAALRAKADTTPGVDVNGCRLRLAELRAQRAEAMLAVPRQRAKDTETEVVESQADLVVADEALKRAYIRRDGARIQAGIDTKAGAVAVARVAAAQAELASLTESAVEAKRTELRKLAGLTA